jgi:hypothetical protein
VFCYFLLMTSNELEKIKRLCGRILAEKDPGIFDDLVRELKNMLDQTLGTKNRSKRLQ